MRLKSFKTFVLSLPEYLLIAAVVFYWISAGQLINYIAIILIIVLVLQMIFKNKVIGILIPCLLALTSLYMILAVISEVSEFPSFNSEAKTLVFVGFSYFLTTLFVSILMIYKYALLPKKRLSH